MINRGIPKRCFLFPLRFFSVFFVVIFSLWATLFSGGGDDTTATSLSKAAIPGVLRKKVLPKLLLLLLIIVGATAGTTAVTTTMTFPLPLPLRLLLRMVDFYWFVFASPY